MVFKCKMCGGDLNPDRGSAVCECEFCGTKQTVPAQDDEKKASLFNRANRLRMRAEFDKAAAVYAGIAADFPEEAEAYWGLCLCRYGIEYVTDPASGEKKPTCHRTLTASIMKDEDFEQACENADPVAKSLYREEAKAIDRIQQGILQIVRSEAPYDVFICYKETDENGSRTEDSILAQEMYDALTAKGLKVFFARISLEDKLGQQYEPYIYAALASAKVMLAVGTKFEHYDAVWVKNEWSRYLAMMKSEKGKTLIPCFKGLDAYDMPEEFAALQAQDMGKLGWLQDLTRGVLKLCGKEESRPQPASPSAPSGPTAESLLTRAFQFLSEKNWDSANEYAEKALDIEPENGRAWLAKLLVQYKRPDSEALAGLGMSFAENHFYAKALRYGDGALRRELEDACRRNEEGIRQREEQAQREAQAQEEAKREAEANAAENRARLAPLRKKMLAAQRLVDGSIGTFYYIRADGTLGASDAKGLDGYPGTEQWNNLAAIKHDIGTLIGLTKDGRVMISALHGNLANMEKEETNSMRLWRDIVCLSKPTGYDWIGLHSDGTFETLSWDLMGLRAVNGLRIREICSKISEHGFCFRREDNSIWVLNDWRGPKALYPAEVQECCKSGIIEGLVLTDDGTVRKAHDWRKQYIPGLTGVLSILGKLQGEEWAFLLEDGRVIGRTLDDPESVRVYDQSVLAVINYTILVHADGSVSRLVGDRNNPYSVVPVPGVNLFNLQADTVSNQICLDRAKQELANLKGLFTGKRRRELEETIARLQGWLDGQG